MENFPLDALSNGRSAPVCVRIFPGGRPQVILSPSKLFRPPPPTPQKSLTPAGKDINERICGKKRKVNESGGPPSANGPGKRKEAKGVRSWTLGEGWGGGRGGLVQTLGIRARAPGVDPGIVPSSLLSPGNKYPVCAAHEVSGHLRVYLYSMCDAKSRSGAGGEGRGGVGGGKTRESRGERREEKRGERETERERERDRTSSPFAK